MVGTFTYDITHDQWTWSDEIYAIHGLRCGSVTPSTALLTQHMPPEDRERVTHGMIQALRRVDRVVLFAVLQTSTAMSTAELPMPTMSTFLSLNGSAVR